MTTKPKPDKPSDFYQRWILNGHTRERAMHEVLLTYLDKQQSALVYAEQESYKRTTTEAAPPAQPVAAEPIPARLPCPGCHRLHLDEGEFATKAHHTHSCQYCGLTWRPAIVATVGVEFLPGFKNEPVAADPIIRAAQGVALDPGEYEIVEIASWCLQPVHKLGDHFHIVSGISAGVSIDGLGNWRFELWRGDEVTFMTAVRRIKKAAEPAVPVAGEPAGAALLWKMFGNRMSDERYCHMINGAEARSIVDERARLAHERHEALAQVEALTKEQGELKGMFQQAHGVHHSWVEAAQKGDKMQRALAEALGMMNEPDNALAWPASWGELLAAAVNRSAALTAANERTERLEAELALRAPIVDGVRKLLETWNSTAADTWVPWLRPALKNLDAHIAELAAPVATGERAEGETVCRWCEKPKSEHFDRFGTGVSVGPGPMMCAGWTPPTPATGGETATCQWYTIPDMMTGEGTSESCSQPATWRGCEGLTCAKHKCRCAKPVTVATSPAIPDSSTGGEP